MNPAPVITTYQDKLVAIHLYDYDAEKREELEGVALELVDLASPVLYEVRVAESVKDVVDSVSMAFILDYPYQPTNGRACMPPVK